MMENLIKVDAQTYLYRLAHSKTDQAAPSFNSISCYPFGTRKVPARDLNWNAV
jgi:hypothetical protein